MYQLDTELSFRVLLCGSRNLIASIPEDPIAESNRDKLRLETNSTLFVAILQSQPAEEVFLLAGLYDVNFVPVTIMLQN